MLRFVIVFIVVRLSLFLLFRNTIDTPPRNSVFAIILSNNIFEPNTLTFSFRNADIFYSRSDQLSLIYTFLTFLSFIIDRWILFKTSYTKEQPNNYFQLLQHKRSFILFLIIQNNEHFTNIIKYFLNYLVLFRRLIGFWVIFFEVYPKSV